MAWSWTKHWDKGCNGALLAGWLLGHTEDSCTLLCENNPLCGGFMFTPGSCGPVDKCDSLTEREYYVSYNNKPNAVCTECQETTTLPPETTTGSTTSTTGSPETTTVFPETTVNHPESTTKLPETTVGFPETTTKLPETTVVIPETKSPETTPEIKVTTQITETTVSQITNAWYTMGRECKSVAVKTVVHNVLSKMWSVGVMASIWRKLK